MRNFLRNRIAFAVALLVTLWAGDVHAAQPAQPPAGMGKYVLFLKNPPPVPPGQERQKIVEPDFAKLGGQLLQSRDRYRVLFLPPDAVRHLLQDPNVDYVQRIWMGETEQEWVNIDAAVPTGTRRIAAQSDEEPPAWGPKTYSYDGTGNIKHIGLDTFQYDPVSRLKQAVINGTTETYQYDAFGNLKTKQTGTQPASPLTIDSASNRIATQTYDIAGNMTDGGSHSYDSLGMMSATHMGSGRRRFYYTADDERIGIQVDDTIARWKFRDFQGRVLREFMTTAHMQNWEWADWLWTEDYVYAGGALVGGETAGPWGVNGPGVAADRRLRHFHLDHLGSVRMITTQARVSLGVHTYYPFGTEQTLFYQEEQTFGGNGDIRPEPMRFAGHERDFNGYWNAPNEDTLDYMHARYYDARLGRFLSVDPGKDWDAKQPQSWNSYTYVRNNPVNAIDPDGRALNFVAGALLGAAENIAFQVAINALTDRPLTENLAREALTGAAIGATGVGLASLAQKGYNAYRVAKAVSLIENAAFAQRKYSPVFSAGGRFAGRTVDDVAAAVKSGKLSAKDVPIDVIVRDGKTLILNTRSAKALEQAGIPRSQWNVVNRTGQNAYEARLTEQLRRNKLTSEGTTEVRRSGSE